MTEHSAPGSVDEQDRSVVAKTGRIAHDLNNMLIVILGNVEWSADNCADPKVRARLLRAVEAAKRGEALTAELLSMSLPKAKPTPFGFVQSLSDMVGRTVKPKATGVETRGHETILMVEDNADVMEMGHSILSDLGYKVLRATTAEEALSVLEQNPNVDLMFTDIVMHGGMDGVALSKAVRKGRPNVAILLTTGWADRTLNSEDRKGFDLIGKPYRRGDLARKVRVLLDGPKTHV